MPLENRQHIERKIAEEFRIALTRTRTTQIQLAEKTGLPQSKISKLLTNEQRFEISIAIELANALNLNLAEIVARITSDQQQHSLSPDNLPIQIGNETQQSGFSNDATTAQLPGTLLINGHVYDRRS